MNPMAFMASVAGVARAAGETSSANRPCLIGTVDPAYAGLPALPRITFDGEVTLSGKTYPFISGYVPAPSDRVVLVPVGTTYVIVGSLAMSVAAAEGEQERWRTTSQSRTNSAVLIDDDTLFFPVVPNATYRATWELLYSADGTGDMKVALTFPAGATCPWGYYGTSDSGAYRSVGFDNPASGTSFAFGGTGSTNTLNARVEATLFNGATAGFLRLQFAQNTAVSGQSAVIRTGSRLTFKRLA